MPENVRQLFPPVLRGRKLAAATAGDQALARDQPVSSDPADASGAPAAAAKGAGKDGPAAVDRPAGAGGQAARRVSAARAGSAAHAQLAAAAAPAVGGSIPLAAAWGAAPERSVPVGWFWPQQVRRPAGRGPAGRFRGQRQMLWMAVLTVALLATAVGTTAALMREPVISGGGAGSQVRASLSAATAARSAAARWVSRDVSRGAIIGCDTVMCAALVKAGVPSSDLLVITPARPDPLGAGVIVATPVVQGAFGSRLRTEYAPVVLAAFGTGTARVAVRLVAADGATAYEVALRRDLAARKTVGSQLIGNTRITLPAAARSELTAGQVDPRLLITLATLAAKHPIRVLAFTGRPPGASPGVPLAGVELAGAEPKAGLSPHAYLRWITSFLRSQQSIYRAASVATATHDGQPVVSVRFAWPTPIGLLH